MANSLKEYARVVETSASTGTGAMTLAGAVSGFQAFGTVYANGETAIVVITKDTDWEISRVTYATAGNTITRTQVYQSTNADAAVNWGAGDKTIRVIKPGWSDLDAAGRASLLELLASMYELTVASATTCDILGAASTKVAISGTVTITSFGTGAYRLRLVTFTGAMLLTHNAASLILPGGANITTAAGDTCIVVSDGSNNATVLAYQKASGNPVTATSTTEVLTGTDAVKAVTADAVAALWEKGANVASASTISLGEGGYFHITGTTGITDIDFATPKDGRRAWVIFDGALIITHNATTLILPGGANITTAANDRALFVQDNGDNVYCVAYIRATGFPIKPTLPSSTVDNTVPRFDSTAGNVQTSGVTISDSDNLKASTVCSAAMIIADDAATSITPAGTAGSSGIVIITTGNGNPLQDGIVSCYWGGTPASGVIVGGASVVASTGIKSGTTGTDGKLTVSPHSDGKVYIENRLGGAGFFAVCVIGG